MADDSGTRLDPLPSVPEERKDLYALAYLESVRGLTQQAGVVDNVRTRAGLLITASSLVTALLATPAIRDRAGGAGLGAGGWAAIVLFAVSMFLAIRILWPKPDWSFSFDARKIVRMIEGDKGYNLGGLQRRLAELNEESQAENAERIDAMFWDFKWSCVFLVAEVAAWVLVLARVNVGGNAL